MTRTFTLSLALVAASTTFADTITLRSSVRMPADGSALRLVDAAVLDGAEAERFATVELHPAHDLLEAIEIDVHSIQQQLDELGANWAKLALSGGNVVVRPRITLPMEARLNTHILARPAIAPQATHDLIGAMGGEPAAFRPLAAWADEGQIAAGIVEVITQEWGEQAGAVHLALDERSLAALPADATSLTIEPRGSTRGVDWFDVQIRAERGGDRLRPTKTLLVRVDLRVDTRTATAQHRLSANRTLQLDDLSMGMARLRPTDALRALQPEHLIGRRLQRTVESGQPILGSSLEPEMVIQRNDRVQVVMHGPFRLSGNDAVALERGAIGERIKCRWRAGDEPFTALVTGPGSVRAGF
jgi:flagella basal body P-ring formation protein FlgA